MNITISQAHHLSLDYTDILLQIEITGSHARPPDFDVAIGVTSLFCDIPLFFSITADAKRCSLTFLSMIKINERMKRSEN